MERSAGVIASVCDIVSSAKRRSIADWKRLSAAFSRHRRMIRASAGGAPPLSVPSGGCSCRTALIVSAGDSPRNARSPVTIS